MTEGKVQLNISCSPDDRRRWSTKARKAGMSLASWVRERLDGPEVVLEPKGPKPPPMPAAVRQVRDEMVKASKRFPEAKPEPRYDTVIPKSEFPTTPEPSKTLSMADAFRKIQKEKESPPAEIPD